MSLYNDDELTAPAWINQQFLEDVLTQYEKNGNVEVITFELSPATMKGDHYASIMFRCKVSYRFAQNAGSAMQRSLIIKTLPVEEGMKREMLMESKLFETEINMYAETLPKIEKILAECGEPTKLSAEIFYHSLEPHKVIVLEDLCVSGFDTVRSRYLTEDEVRAVYSKVAKLHAVSYMLGHSEDHELVTKYNEGIMSRSMPMMTDMMLYGLGNFMNLLSSNAEFAIYADKLKDMQDEVHQACKDMFNAYSLNNGRGDIFVLNHGDFHMKNLMFKFDQENKMEDLIMVDYQICCYAPSTIDLMYSQYLLLSPDTRLKRHELMHHYFTEFIRILKKLNCPGTMPKYSQFQIAALKYRHFTVFMIAVMLPMVVGLLLKPVEELKDMDTNQLIENPDVVAASYSSPEFIEIIRSILPILLNEGYLD